MISKYGRPQFIKIDVEGYEHVVLEGLSQPVRALSFEFIGEHLASTLECIDKLSSLGKVMFRYSLGESMEWGPSPWSCDDDIKSQLRSLPRELGGDLYARTEVSDDNFHEN